MPAQFSVEAGLVAHIAVISLATRGHSGGYKKYLREILPRMARYSPQCRITLFSLDSNPVDFLDLQGLTSHTASSVRELSALVSRSGANMVFHPNSRLLPRTTLPQVLMLRNMEPFTVPAKMNPPSETLRNFVRSRLARRACLGAHGVIAVSNHVGKMLLEEWGLPSSRMRIIHHGVEDVMSAASKPVGAPAGPFVLTAGSIRPARGLVDAINAIWELARRGHDLELVIVGAVDPRMRNHHRALRRLAAELGVESRVRWLGQLRRSEMAWLFSTARAFVMTTRAEACPNLALEAMAAGCLSVATAIDPMPEFFGEAAHYYPPGSYRTLAIAIEHLLHADASSVTRMATKARYRARAYSWDRCAQETTDFLLKSASIRSTHVS